MKQRGKLLAVITSCVLVLSSSSVVYSSAASDNIKTDVISEELHEILNSSNDSELITISVVMEDLNHLLIDEMIENSSDFKVKDYKDILTFRSNVMPDIVKSTEKKYGYEKSHILALENSDTYEIEFSVDKFIDENLKPDYVLSKVNQRDLEEISTECLGASFVTREISKNIDEYTALRRKCVSQVYEKYNSEFIEKYVNTDDIVCNVYFAPSVVVKANKSTIKKISKDSQVISLDYFKNFELESSLSDSLLKTSVSDVQSNLYNFGNGYNGDGVKIGIIEAASGMYDGNSFMLNNVPNLEYVTNSYVTSGSLSDHATLVTSIIKGSRCMVYGERYSGIVPNSIVYQTSCNNLLNLPNIIYELCNRGVSVINHSANLNYGASPIPSTYGWIDWILDNAIDNYGVVFVNSAGNSGYNVVSPAKSYNAIAVGNLDTKNTESPYSLESSSAYHESVGVANKPDVVAPGTDIYVPGFSRTYTGTSLSAPVVTGIAAQLIQCDPTLKVASNTDFQGKTYYNTVKALIMIGSNNNSISSANNSPSYGNSGTCNYLFRDKSGAGLVNAKKSIDSLLTYGTNLNLINMNINSNGTNLNGMGFIDTFYAGDKVKVVFCHSKIDEDNNNNFKLKMFDSNNNLVASSIPQYDNVSILEYTVPSNGQYLIRVYSNSLSISGNVTLPGSIVMYVE